MKKGERSVGVARQYTGTAGDTVNCQVGAFLVYASNKGAAFIDRALCLPEEWAKDPERRAEAGVPEEVAFANKVELAKGMLGRALAAEIPAWWVAANSFYGRSHEFRSWLEERGRAYAVMVPKTTAVPLGGRKKKIEQLVERLGEDAFSEVHPAQDRQTSQRPPRGARRHPVGGEDWLLLAGDAREVRQVGNRLPAPRAVGKAGPLAAHPPRFGRGRSAGTGDEGT